MNKIIKVIKNSFETLKLNHLLIGLIFSAVLSDFILRLLTVGNIFKVKPIITSIAVVLIISSIAILLANKKRKYVYIVFSTLFGLLSAANYLYYTHFNSFISVGIFNQARQLKEMKNSLTQIFNIKVILFVIPTFLFYLFYKKLQKKGYYKSRSNEFSVRKEVRSPFILGLILLLMVATTLTGSDVSRLVKQWNKDYLVEQFGIYTLASVDLIKSATVPRAIQADYGDYDEKMNALVKKNEKEINDNKYTDVLQGKDLYVIHYESVQNFAMDLSFEDGEATPFLNKLAKDSLFFNNFYPQHSVGTSSDSEFTFSTSLYPINNSTVFIDHAEKEFETIQKLLVNKGYHTMSMHANNGGFWNRDIMYSNIGYNEFLDKEDYIIDEEVGLGLSDKSFYKQSVKKINQRKNHLDKPIMATLISLSHHYPFNDLEMFDDFDTGYLEGSDISNYLKSIHYADQALELFFTEMEEAKLLDNAVVIIYGDHHAKISDEDYELLYNYDLDLDEVIDKQNEDYINIDNAYLRQVRKTPLLIWTKDGSLNNVVKQPMGMIDVMPTLSNMFNLNNPYQLGKDIFNIDDNTVIFPDGSFLTKEYYYSASGLKVYDMKTNELLSEEQQLDEDLLDKIETIEQVLDLSSNIIENDLIRYYQDYQK